MRELSCFVIIPSGKKVQLVADKRTGFAEIPSSCTLPEDPPEPLNFDAVYQYIVRAAIDKVNKANPDLHIECLRGEDIKQPGDIISHMMRQICNADITITDITGNNPNVFLEYGIRLSVKDNLNILIRHELSEPPFNIEHIRAIPYSTGLEGSEAARDKIAGFLQDFLDSPSVEQDRSRYFDYVDLYTSRLMEKKLAAVARDAPRLVAELASVVLTNPGTAHEFRQSIFAFLAQVQTALKEGPKGRRQVIEHLKLTSEVKGIDKGRLRDTYYQLANLCDADDELKDDAKRYLAEAKKLEE